jgi:hypothetical protein
VLGPPLFTVYINDLDQAVKFIEMLKKFADDTKLGQTATQEGRACLQRALDMLCEWADQWSMEFNVKKCKVMHLGHNNMSQDYYMNGHKLEVTEEERDIGVIVSKNLKPASQCKKAARTARLYFLKYPEPSTTGTNTFSFASTYLVQYVRPNLEFAVPAWSP